jgi:microcystin-dependent protein
MGQPYVGEIRMFAGNFAPAGWDFCSGQLLPISENETLFQLIGTTYGGDGQETFALPNLQSRLPVHKGSGGGGTYTLAETGGAESVTLTTQQIPNHTHAATCKPDGSGVANPANAVWNVSDVAQYTSNAVTGNMKNPTLTPAGGSQPHENMMPYLCINFIISLFGLFPSPT